MLTALTKIRSPNALLGLVCLAIFLGAVDLTVVTAVLPKILLDLQVSIDTELNHAAWIITGYLLAYTISMTFMGRLSDLYGRQAIYMICLVLFIAGSVIVAVAPVLNVIIGGRVVQAFGAGALVPIAMALVGDLFPPERRPAALGVIAAVDTAGWMVGHLYGGVLMRVFDSWRLLFLVNIPLGLAVLVLTWGGIRGLSQQRAHGSFDWLGALLLAASLSALTLGLSAGAELGQTDLSGLQQPQPYAMPLVVTAFVLLAGFVWVERRVRSPLLEMELFANRAVRAACIINALIGFALALAIANVPLFINTRLILIAPADPEVLRRGAWDSGWVLSALTFAMAGCSVPGGWLAARFRERLPTLAGMLVAIGGYLFLCRWGATTTYLEMVGGLALAGAGLGLVLSPAATTIVNAVNDDRRGIAASLVIILRLVGMTIGVSVLTLWGVHRQDVLRRAGVSDPLAASDPALFLLQVAATVVAETFLFAVVACLLSLLAAWYLAPKSS